MKRDCMQNFPMKICQRNFLVIQWLGSFPGGSVIKNPLANVGVAGLIPGSGRSPGEGDDNPLQYSCPGNPIDRGAWWVPVHGVAKESAQLSDKTTTFFYRKK